MKIAIVEDDINYRKSLETAFEDYAEYEVVSFKNPKDALKKLDESFELIITDINMPQMDGLSFLQELNGRYEAIVITGNASVQNAIKSIRLGVKDFLIKGFEIEELIEAIKRTHKAAQIVHKTQKTPPKSTDDKEFIASSPKLEEVKALALKVAKTDANVLLLGQSGVGKDVFANFIHRNSARANAPFVALNMAAIPEHLLESELFGYEKGAFTDATNPKPGILESASGGSVFLDEIGEMPLALQAKLLRRLHGLVAQSPLRLMCALSLQQMLIYRQR